MFRLAGHLGMTVGELGQRMSSRELSEWMAYDAIEPIGNHWQQTGMVAATVANVNRDPKKRANPFQPEDFMPKLAEEPALPDTATLASKIKGALKVTD